MSDASGLESTPRYIRPDEVAFHRTDGGFVSMRLGEQSWPRVHLYRAFPVSRAADYVCIRDEEGKEIGILEGLEGLGAEALELISEELDRRYYTPVIRTVVSLKEEFGYTYWTVVTDRGERRFTVQCGGNNAHTRDGGSILLVDVDGNRYELPDPTSLDRARLRVLETLL